MDDDFLFLAYLWLVHVVVTSPVVAPLVWLTRRRVQWHVWELAVFIVPYGVWFGLMNAGLRPKTLANLGESFYISAAIVVAAIAQALFSRTFGNRIVPAVVMTAVIAAAVAAYLLTPMWPEV